MSKRDVTLASTPLLEYLEKLEKKNTISKPRIFDKHTSTIKNHLERLENYCHYIGIKSHDDMGKILVLLDTLSEDIRYELMFDEGYKQNRENFAWHAKRLIEMFPVHENKTVELLELNRIQQNNRPFDEYASHIKVSCSKKAHMFELGELQTMAREIFLNGLDDPEIKRAVKQQSPRTIDEALSIVKNLSLTQSSCSNICRRLRRDVLEEDKISNLVKKIDLLTNIVIDLQRQLQEDKKKIKNGSRNVYRDRKYYQVPRKFFGQIANGKEIRANEWRYNTKNGKPLICFGCGAEGHMRRNCSKNGDRRFRLIQNRDELLPVETGAKTEEWEVQSIAYEDDTRSDVDLCVLSSEEKKRAKLYPEEIEDLNKFILTGRKTKSCKKLLANYARTRAETVITQRNEEKARNKPIVRGLVNERHCKIFLDSGSEVNVVDRAFLSEVLHINSADISKPSTSIRCANESKLRVVGEVIMEVVVGKVRRLLKFLIAENIFPNVIIGITGLKTLKISLDAANSCVAIEGEKIPFMSRVESEKNGRVSYREIAIRHKN